MILTITSSSDRLIRSQLLTYIRTLVRPWDLIREAVSSRIRFLFNLSRDCALLVIVVEQVKVY